LDPHTSELIALAARTWGGVYGVTLKPELVRAIVLEESGGDTLAVRREPDGRISRGLMQVLEGTARDMGLDNPKLLHEPAIGISYGVRYLARQLQRYRGNVAAAVAAYNAGRAVRLASGQWKNQGYVSRVLSRLGGAGAAAGAGLVALGAAALLFILLSKRKAHA
jgi:soluble lytic murein transglycosylase-like protein